MGWSRQIKSPTPFLLHIVLQIKQRNPRHQVRCKILILNVVKFEIMFRLNKPYYDASEFTSHGIAHLDLYFPDGTNPPDSILEK